MHVPGRGIGLFVATLGAPLAARCKRGPSWPKPADLRRRSRAGATWWASHAGNTTLWVLVLALGFVVGLVVARL
jgi:hypothetical protein